MMDHGHAVEMFFFHRIYEPECKNPAQDPYIVSRARLSFMELGRQHLPDQTIELAVIQQFSHGHLVRDDHLVSLDIAVLDLLTLHSLENAPNYRFRFFSLIGKLMYMHPV